MTLYKDRIYPRLVSILGNPEPIRTVRRRIIPRAHGRVLEIGVGPGVNFPHYDPARVAKLYALEPNPGMLRLAARQRQRTTLDVEFLGLPGERLPLADGSVDTVVSTFTLCTIPRVGDGVRELRRVLGEGGALIFFEHGLSPDPRVHRWQRWTEPITRCVFAGCHLTRDVPSVLEQGGFEIEERRWRRPTSPCPRPGRTVGRARPFRSDDRPVGQDQVVRAACSIARV